jgi:hypothetical protein
MERDGLKSGTYGTLSTGIRAQVERKSLQGPKGRREMRQTIENHVADKFKVGILKAKGKEI